MRRIVGFSVIGVAAGMDVGDVDPAGFDIPKGYKIVSQVFSAGDVVPPVIHSAARPPRSAVGAAVPAEMTPMRFLKPSGQLKPPAVPKVPLKAGGTIDQPGHHVLHDTVTDLPPAVAFHLQTPEEAVGEGKEAGKGDEKAANLKEEEEEVYDFDKAAKETSRKNIEDKVDDLTADEKEAAAIAKAAEEQEAVDEVATTGCKGAHPRCLEAIDSETDCKALSFCTWIPQPVKEVEPVVAVLPKGAGQRGWDEPGVCEGINNECKGSNQGDCEGLQANGLCKWVSHSARYAGQAWRLHRKPCGHLPVRPIRLSAATFDMGSIVGGLQESWPDVAEPFPSKLNDLCRIKTISCLKQRLVDPDYKCADNEFFSDEELSSVEDTRKQHKLDDMSVLKERTVSQKVAQDLDNLAAAAHPVNPEELSFVLHGQVSPSRTGSSNILAQLKP